MYVHVTCVYIHNGVIPVLNVGFKQEVMNTCVKLMMESTHGCLKRVVNGWLFVWLQGLQAISCDPRVAHGLK